MAEERLIDDDKDKKYKIRINEQGEEELVLDETRAESDAEESDEVGFEVPELDEDDEEAAVMTPEQLAARDKAREEAESKRLKNIAERVERAGALIDAGKFEDAVFVADEGLGFGNDGELYCLKLKALTQNFTDYSRASECDACADGVGFHADENTKSVYAPDTALLKEQSESLAEEVKSVGLRNDEQKAERGTRYLKKRKTALVFFTATCIPLAVFAILAIYFSTVMHAELSNTNMILFFVFLGVSAVFLIAALIATRMLWQSARLLKLNASNSSTKLGREFEDKSARLAAVNKILSVFGEKE